MPDQGYGGLDSEPESGSARNVVREVGAYINAREADDRHGCSNKSAPGRAQSGEGSRAHGHRHARVARQVTEARSIAAAGAGAADQRRWPGSAHHLLDQLGQGPSARAAREQMARKLTVVGQQRCDGCRGHGAERAQLHDDPNWTVEGVGQAVDGPECLSFTVAYPVSARR